MPQPNGEGELKGTSGLCRHSVQVTRPPLRRASDPVSAPRRADERPWELGPSHPLRDSLTSFLAVGPRQVLERLRSPDGAYGEALASVWQRHQPPSYHAGSVALGEISMYLCVCVRACMRLHVNVGRCCPD